MAGRCEKDRKIRDRRFFGRIVSVICIAVLFSACDPLYRLLQKEGAEERDLIGDVIPYESNPKVEEIQKLLHLYGYKSGNRDGKLGPQTRSAIERFQRDNGLKVTRFVDNATWAQLTMFEGYGLVVGGEINMAAVQQALKNAGFSPGTVDGKPGPRTERAIKKFQKAMGLKDDGAVGYKTLLELKDFLIITEAELQN